MSCRSEDKQAKVDTVAQRVGVARHTRKGKREQARDTRSSDHTQPQQARARSTAGAAGSTSAAQQAAQQAQR